VPGTSNGAARARPTGRPVVGITAALERSRYAVWERDAVLIARTYVDIVLDAGGVPVLLPPVVGSAHAVDRVDAVLLSGGRDVAPDRYGAAPHPATGVTHPDRDGAELAVLDRALELGLPVLGVCRGAQALNVARGGTLHQHVAGHRQSEPATTPTHAVALAPSSRLAQIAGATELVVNSFHHQAVDAPGAGLRVVGRASDGGVEAIEDTARPFVIGVQWHAETLPAHAPLFAALVAAAAGGEARTLRAA